jgi:hypothetical protein
VVDIVLHPEAVPVQPPNVTIDLLSLDELKLAMGIPPTDTAQDAQLSMWITRFSDVIATTCNRVFAYGQVIERWQCLQSNRIFLTRYPVKAADVTSITVGPDTSAIELDPATDWILEEPSGKIELLGNKSQPITVTYSGGFNLPDEAPPALKQACELLVWEWRAIAMRLALGGVSSIRHKESDVRYFDPLALLRGKNGIGWAGSESAINALLMHYVRLQV